MIFLYLDICDINEWKRQHDHRKFTRNEIWKEISRKRDISVDEMGINSLVVSSRLGNWARREGALQEKGTVTSFSLSLTVKKNLQSPELSNENRSIF